MAATWFWVGILINVAGAFFGAVGDNLVRKAYINTPSFAKISDMIGVPMWWAGIFCSAVVNISCTSLSLYLIPASIVTAFAGLHIFFVVLLSKLWLREKITSYDFIAAICEIVGISFIILSSDTPTTNDFYGIMDNFPSARGLLYVTASSFIIFFGLASSAFSFDNFPLIFKFRKIITPASCGFSGAFSNLFAKGALSGFRDLSVYVVSIRQRMFLVFILIIAVLALVLQAILLNECLKGYAAGIVVPAINSSLILSGAAGSYLLLNETPSNLLLFLLGLILVILGLFVLLFTNLLKHRIVNLSCLRTGVNQAEIYPLDVSAYDINPYVKYIDHIDAESAYEFKKSVPSAPRIYAHEEISYSYADNSSL